MSDFGGCTVFTRKARWPMNISYTFFFFPFPFPCTSAPHPSSQPPSSPSTPSPPPLLLSCPILTCLNPALPLPHMLPTSLPSAPPPPPPPPPPTPPTLLDLLPKQPLSLQKKAAHSDGCGVGWGGVVGRGSSAGLGKGEGRVELFFFLGGGGWQGSHSR